MSAACHPLCTIGPRADHDGSSEYRCIDADGTRLPFPNEPGSSDGIVRRWAWQEATR